MPDYSYLISCDWGTSAFRLRLLQGKDQPKILAERSSSRGIVSFPPADENEFQNYLILELDRLFRGAKLSPEAIPIYLSGMVTSTLGWRELPYADLPFALDGSSAIFEETILQRVYGTHTLRFVSGLKSGDDVLRGEETELIGILQDPRFRKWVESSVAVLPGTHSKVVEIDNKTVVGFQTYLTGELFHVLRHNSILKHSVEAEASPEEGALDLFECGVRRAADKGMLESLFSVRTNVLLKGIPKNLNTFYLSGLLLGTEAASILKKFPSPRPILLCGAVALQSFYRRAFEVLGASARIHMVPEEITSVASALGHWRIYDLRFTIDD